MSIDWVLVPVGAKYWFDSCNVIPESSLGYFLLVLILLILPQ